MTTNNLKSYGVRQTTELHSDADRYREEIMITGFTVVPDVVADSELEEARKRIDAVYAAQASEVGGEENLRKINDALVGRCLLAYDDYFLSFATSSVVHTVVGSLLGDYFTLLQQNAVINAPTDKHYQSAWHRDLAYQHFVSSKPLAI